MSPYERRLILYMVAFSFGAVVLFAFVIGFFISPFWCDVRGVNFVTCFGDRSNYTRQQAEYYANQPQSESEAMPGETPESNNRPQPQPTAQLYENLEAAATKDPQLVEFLETFKTAVETKDYQTIEGLITDPFNVGPYGSSYATLDKEQAMEKLKEILADEHILVVTTNEGRDIAQALSATPRDASFALIAYGVPHDSYSILGISQTDQGYFWSDLILLQK